MSASINDYKGLRSYKRTWRRKQKNIREYWERYRRSRRDRVLYTDIQNATAARAFLRDTEASDKRLALWELSFLLSLVLLALVQARSCL